MGLVKNRCKNGDYYWVSAYVTPVTENGKVVGYESVRSCPDRQDVARAEKLYADIRSGNSGIRFWQRFQQPTLFFAFVLIVAGLWFLDG